MVGEDLVCANCGGTLFERRVICKYQLGSKYVPQKDFIPIEQYTHARCIYCGAFHNLDGKQVEPGTDVLTSDSSVELEAKKDG